MDRKIFEKNKLSKEIFNKIVAKKEFSDLPREDVERAWKVFEKRQTSVEDKIKLCRDLLRKMFFSFGSLKLLSPRIVDKKSVEEILKKHVSTRERFDFYDEVYGKIFSGFEDEKKISVIDLGAGVNGLSFGFFENFFSGNLNYVGVEGVGQLVDLMNYFFKTRGIEHAGAIQMSLFEIEKLKKIIQQTSKLRIIFLFKTLDSLEMLERNFSKNFLKEIVPLADLVVVSFATRSLVSKKNFQVKRFWFENFAKENFKIIEKFEIGGEKYFLIKEKN